MELSFREKKISPGTKRRVLILAAVFVAALIFFEIVLNYQREGRGAAMGDAALPVVTMEACGRTMNELHGYTREMDACYMRDAVLPLEADRVLPLTVHTYGYTVQSASYEIRSLDTERKIAETQIDNFTRDGDDLRADVQIENLVEEGEEYLFSLTLEGEQDQQVRYYTRIMLPDDCHEKECLDFAEYFHETALSGNYSELNTYLETDTNTDMDTLSQVTIHSSIQQVGWKGFAGTVVGEPVVEMKEINSSYVALEFYYQIQRQDAAGKTHTYQVEEYFKIRYGGQRMYLLDYSRTMEEYLTQENLEAGTNDLSLGVAGNDLTYFSNETGTVVAFVQTGELYLYDQNNRELTRVFSFIGDDLSDIRENYRQHDIRILNMDESGNMDFVVYGYMNRGSHEGECGISLYHYDRDLGQAREQIFVAGTSSYQILRAGFSDLLYKNSDEEFYIMVDGTLLQVDLDTMESKELLTGLTQEQYAVSGSGRKIAWITSDGMEQKISLMNLETGTTWEIVAGDGELVRPIAFLDEDFVYGIARSGDVVKDSAGAAVYPMYKLRIVDTSSSDFPVLKEYERADSYILSVTQQGHTLFLNRAVRSGDTYVPIDGDTIQNSSGEPNRAVTIQGTADNALGKVTRIVMAGTGDEETAASVRFREAELTEAEGNRSILLETSTQAERYFVYVGSNVTLSTGRMSEAVAAADADMGIVVDNHQRYVWRRGRSTARTAFSDLEVGSYDTASGSSARCLSAMLAREGKNVAVASLLSQGQTPAEVLREELEDQAVLDLTGCTLSQVLYYVSLGNPVYGRTGADAAMLVTGYDASSVSLWDPMTGETQRMGLTDAENLFAAAGNVFVSYAE